VEITEGKANGLRRKRRNVAGEKRFKMRRIKDEERGAREGKVSCAFNRLNPGDSSFTQRSLPFPLLRRVSNII
jgi:hypothetical protein